MIAAVIGTGVIGAGWAARFALHGVDVRLYDAKLDEAQIQRTLGEARDSLTALYDKPLPDAGHVRCCDALQDAVDGAGWIQESVPEQLALKTTILEQIESAALPDAVIASSTSGFTPSTLQEGLRHPERVLVCHPFNPVYLLPLVEVVRSPVTSQTVADRAERFLYRVGMKPLTLEREIDAHVADRLLEAVWREALWLVRDGVATTEQVDDAIRYGFGLRWAQMGLFETYRLAGGEAGMRHFLAQFGPALAWPWSRLTDVPELDDALIERIAEQSDRQSAGRSIEALRHERDRNLVAILRALKETGSAAGAHVARWEQDHS